MKQTMYHFRNPPTCYTPLNVLLAGGSHLACLTPFAIFAISHLARWLLSHGTRLQLGLVRPILMGASAPHLWGYRKLGYVLPWRHAKRHLLQD